MHGFVRVSVRARGCVSVSETDLARTESKTRLLLKLSKIMESDFFHL